MCLTADYPSPAKTAATPPSPATSASSSADALHLDGFGLDSRHLASRKRDGFSPRDREGESSGRKNHCKFHVHHKIPEVCKSFTINEATRITNIKQRECYPSRNLFRFLILFSTYTVMHVQARRWWPPGGVSLRTRLFALRMPCDQTGSGRSQRRLRPGCRLEPSSEMAIGSHLERKVPNTPRRP